MSQPKTYGITEPLSFAEPTKEQLDAQKRLIKELLPLDVFETEEEQAHRREVLGKMNELATTWIKETILSKTNSQSIADNAGGQIFTFGSFRLGVNARSGDIDTLVVAPRHVTREDFFDTFYKKLEAHPETENLHAASDAFVPVIKLDFMKIEMDLLFARMALEKVPADIDLKQMELLKNLDEKCILSLNGCRVTDSILSLVPNVDEFRILLRTIKLWAKKRAVYSNVLGYCGGVQLAMLSARVCQFYPKATAASLIQKFFQTWKMWNWPNPVMLCDRQEPGSGYSSCQAQWDPRVNVRDRAHKMPIITPAFPCQNSTVSCGTATLLAMKEEFERGDDICKQILASGGRVKWSKLWEPSEFFLQYRNLIVIKAHAPNQDALTAYAGLVQACVKKFVENIPEHALGVPYPKEFSVPRKDGSDDEFISEWYIGLKEAPPVEGRVVETGVNGRPLFDLSQARDQFGRLIERKQYASEDMQADDNDLLYTKVLPIRASALPDYVFPDDRRPERKKKKKKKKKAAAEAADSVLSPPSPSAGAGEAAETGAADDSGGAALEGDAAGEEEAGTNETKDGDAEAQAEKSAKRKVDDLDDNDLELDEAAPVTKVLKLNTVSPSGGPKLKL